VGSGKFIFIKLPPHFALYILALSNVGPGHSTEEFTLTAPKSVRLVLAGKFMLLYFRRGWATVLPTSSWFFFFFLLWATSSWAGKVQFRNLRCIEAFFSSVRFKVKLRNEHV